MVVNIKNKNVTELDAGIYDIKFELKNLTDETNKSPPRKQLSFLDSDENWYSITLFEDSTSQDIFEYDYEIDSTYKLTNINYKDNKWDNFNPTEDSKIKIEEENSKNKSNNIEVNDSNHFVTTFKSKKPLNIDSIEESIIKTKKSNQLSSAKEKRRITYKARRDVYRNLNISSIAIGNNLNLYCLKPIDVETNRYNIIHKKSREIDFKDKKDRKIIKDLIEGYIKTNLNRKYKVKGIDKILSQNPVYKTDNYRLHERYKLSVSISSYGYVYIDVFFKHKIESDLYVSELSTIPSGLKVKTAYNYNQGHIISKVRNDKVTDPLTELGNESILEYHKKNNTLSDEQLDNVKNSDKPLVDAWTRSANNDKRVFPQEALIVGTRPEQLHKYDKEFAYNMREYTHVSSKDYWDKIHTFIKQNHIFELENEDIQFNTQPISDNGSQKVKRLYEPNENILRFGDGSGSHPSELFKNNRSAAKPVSNYNLAVIYPETNEKSVENFTQNISKKLSDINCKPNISQKIPYNPMGMSINKLEDDVISSLNNDIDCVLFVLIDEVNLLDFDSSEQYDRIKRALADKGIPSQMVERENIKNSSSTKERNISLGILAASGGIPFTPDINIPGKTDMFIGIDVASKYDANKNNKQSIAASSMAVMSDGTILGSTVDVPQRGEKISGDTMRSVVHSAIKDYESEKSKKPSHITIHRDGYCNESLDKVFKLLDEFNITYDIIEIKKQPKTRILRYDDDIKVPQKGVAFIDELNSSSIILNWGAPEYLAERNKGIPRPLQINKKCGSTSIDTISKQIYLLSQANISVDNTTVRLPITTFYADKVGEASINGWLSNKNTSGINTKLGFL